MYNKIKSDGLLIECGFLSNSKDRENLTNNLYQKTYAINLRKAIIQYFTSN